LLNKVYPDSFRQRFVTEFDSRGVKVILNDYVDDIPPDGSAPNGITTRLGKHLDADLVVSTRGGRPNTSFLKSAGFDLTPGGQVCVEETLQAKNHPNVFVVGDIIGWNEQKQSAKVEGHRDVVVANILSFIEGSTVTTQYVSPKEVIIVTNGKVGAYVRRFSLFS
jgi:apoptosis-inducing factor 2